MDPDLHNPAGATRPLAHQPGAVLAGYISLTKPRTLGPLLVVSLAVVMVAAARAPSPVLLAATLAGSALMTGAANALNCVLDRDIDGLMRRTRNRPLVEGILSQTQAVAFGFLLLALAFLILDLGANQLSALLAFAGLVIYVLAYTPAKRATPMSVVIGALAGATAPLIAWAAVRGSLSMSAVFLSLIMALWDVPHTLAFMLAFCADYARARLPVLPVVRGMNAARRALAGYTMLLWAVSVIPALIGLFGRIYGVGAFLLGGPFVMLALGGLVPSGLRGVERPNDLRVYRYSVIYVILLFVLMALDRLVHVLWLG
jgi:protoheme IX farnesyltransferase